MHVQRNSDHPQTPPPLQHATLLHMEAPCLPSRPPLPLRQPSPVQPRHRLAWSTTAPAVLRGDTALLLLAHATKHLNKSRRSCQHLRHRRRLALDLDPTRHQTPSMHQAQARLLPLLRWNVMAKTKTQHATFVCSAEAYAKYVRRHAPCW